jgi:hypothetical protein
MALPYNTKAETTALIQEVKRQFGTGIIGVIYPNISGIPQFEGSDVTQNGIYIVGADGDYGDITGITLTNQIVLLEIKDIDTTPFYNDIITTISLTINYQSYNTYADMIAAGTPLTTTIVRVLVDEDKGLENTEYRLYTDGVRMWIANTIDN